MNYKRIYETQYGEKKLIHTPKKQFMGLRKLLARYDQDREDVIEQLVGSGEKMLDIGCGNGHTL